MGLHVRGSNEILPKVVKKVCIAKAENLMEKEDFKKNSQMSLKINGTKGECMDSLFIETTEEIDADLSWK